MTCGSCLFFYFIKGIINLLKYGEILFAILANNGIFQKFIDFHAQLFETQALRIGDNPDRQNNAIDFDILSFSADGDFSPFAGQGVVGLKWSIFDSERVYNGGKFVISKKRHPLSIQSGVAMLEELAEICAKDIASSIHNRIADV